MKRVMIVEDEKLVLLGIESLFETNADYHVVGSFSRASAALDAIKALNPDIILTDIKMPGMDGLEFITKLQARDCRAKIIVLSCLEEFSIVSKAFKLGAIDYILKHQLDESELFSILDNIPIENNPSEFRVFGDQWGGLRRFSERLKESLVPKIENPIIYLMVCKKRYSEDNLPQDTGVDTMWALRFIRDLLEDYHLGEVYREDSQSLVLVLDGGEAAQEQRNRFFQRLTRQLAQFINSPIVILRSSNEEIIPLQEQWELLQKSRDTAFYTATTKVVMLKASKEVDWQIQLPEPALLLRKDDVGEWLKGMENYFELVKRSRMDSSRLCMQLIVHWHQVQQLLNTLHIPKYEIQEDSLFEHLKKFDDVGHLKRWYMRELPKRIAPLYELGGYSRKIFKIKLYLLKHYDQHITLKMVAEKMHMNCTYLCELFKRETGIGFIDYLNTIRIDKAKALLLECDATVESVAVQVGYSSASHFSRLFKKLTGYTVTEYRMSHGPNIIEENQKLSIAGYPSES